MVTPASFLRVAVLLAVVVSSASAATRISYPSFSPHDEDIMALGDSKYDFTNQSYIINAGAGAISSRGSCGAVVYGKAVRIQNVATGRLASFSTSFSFRFATHGSTWDHGKHPSDGSGFAFVIIRNTPLATMQDGLLQFGKFGACRSYQSQTPRILTSVPRFVVHLDTDYSANRKDSSNNFLQVTKDLADEFAIDPQGYTYDFCGNDTHCEYFTNGRVFTLWIDFSASQTLEVWIANGSDPKPLQPLLRISNYNFPKSLGDDVYLTFWGSSDVNHLEEHELLSWSFFSSEVPESKLRRLLHYLKSETWVRITSGVVFGTMAALVILWLVSSFATPSSSYSAFGYSKGHRMFTYKELRKATENFSERNVLGRGGSGVVYKGSLQGGGVLIAVKQINVTESKQAQSLFHAEVTSLGQIQHRNVVRLRGWCQEKGQLLLVYDYMSNGNLNDWLYKSHSNQGLSLKVRQSILEGVGSALEYLHEGILRCVLHRDIKSSNVLLDEDFNAYIGDFGLACLMEHHKLDKTTMAAGTFGYMAPELPYTGKATKESDVYSFGILVLEVMCGQHPFDVHATEPEDIVLLHTVWRSYENGSLLSMADPQMIETIQPSRESNVQIDEATCATQDSSQPSMTCNLTYSDTPRPIVLDVNIEVENAMVISLLQLGLLCCLPNPKSRPSMGEVNGILKQILNIKDELPITVISLASLPSTRPLGLYHSFGMSHSAKQTSTARSPSSLV